MRHLNEISWQIITNFLWVLGMGAIIVLMIPSVACNMHVHAGSGHGQAGGHGQASSCVHEIHDYSGYYDDEEARHYYDGDYHAIVKSCAGRSGCHYHKGEYAYGNGGSSIVYKMDAYGEWKRVKRYHH